MINVIKDFIDIHAMKSQKQSSAMTHHTADGV